VAGPCAALRAAKLARYYPATYPRAEALSLSLSLSLYISANGPRATTAPILLAGSVRNLPLALRRGQ
jgi:hypothetical protein